MEVNIPRSLINASGDENDILLTEQKLKTVYSRNLGKLNFSSKMNFLKWRFIFQVLFHSNENRETSVGAKKK